MKKILQTGLALVALNVKRYAAARPKDKTTIVIIPRRSNAFTGNSKYFFCYLVAQAQSHNLSPYLLMKNCPTYHELKAMGAPVLAYPSRDAFRVMMSAGITIVENTLWGRGLRSAFLAGSQLYQVWHGTGIKNVGEDDPRIAQRKGKSFFGRLRAAAFDTDTTYDIMVFSSQAHMEGRKHAFNFKDYFINGQPRNDVIFGTFEGNAMAELGTDAAALDKIRAARADGKKVILYTPTWRKRSSDQPQDFFDWPALENFARGQNAIVIVKPHPKDVDYAKASDVIVPYAAARDVYHAFPYVDVMISDFSSIFTDFLLINKPLVFFQPDREEYAGTRGFQFDLDAVLPGPIVHDQTALNDALVQALKTGGDAYGDARKRVLAEFCAFTDGNSCARLLDHIMTSKASQTAMDRA